MKNNNKHELLTSLHLRRKHCLGRGENDSEKLDFFYDFLEVLGIFLSKHCEEARKMYGRDIGVHMLMTAIEAACALDPEFADVLYDAYNKLSDPSAENEEYIN